MRFDRRRLATVISLIVMSLMLVGHPAPSGAKSSRSEMIAARQRFFGKQNVDARTGAVRKDRVILSWFSVSNYVASFNGHVVLIDAWIARGSHSGYVPTTPDELAAARPEFIFIGHGDFDHAADAAEIAVKSGATVVGTAEHCDSIQSQAGEDEVSCFEVSELGAAPGLVEELDLLPGVDITAVIHQHSSFERPEQQDGGRLPCIPVWPVQDTVEHPPTAEDFTHLLRHLPDARGGNILYQFRVGDFALTWHDTTGKIKEDAPQVVDALRGLPPTDVHSGAILAFGQVTNCFRSLSTYIEALSPKVFAANHHDNFTYFLGADARDLEPYVREELARIPAKDRPKLLYTYNPDDYLNPKPFTFDPSAREWR